MSDEEPDVWRFVCPEGDFTSEYNPVKTVYEDETCPECGEPLEVEQAVWVSDVRNRLNELADAASPDRIQSNGHDEHFLAGKRAAYDKLRKELDSGLNSGE